MLFSLEDSHANAASRRPQSGLKVLPDSKPQPLKYCFRMRILMQRRPQGGLKVASKAPQDFKARRQNVYFACRFPLESDLEAASKLPPRRCAIPKHNRKHRLSFVVFLSPALAFVFSSKDKEKTYAYKKCSTRHIARSGTPQ